MCIAVVPGKTKDGQKSGRTILSARCKPHTVYKKGSIPNGKQKIYDQIIKIGSRFYFFMSYEEMQKERPSPACERNLASCALLQTKPVDLAGDMFKPESLSAARVISSMRSGIPLDFSTIIWRIENGSKSLVSRDETISALR